eukprot:7243062-Pyramimonas_sp.AAC.1
MAVKDQVLGREAGSAQGCLQHRLAQVQGPAEAHREHHHLREQEVVTPRAGLHASEGHQILCRDRRQGEELLHPSRHLHVVESDVQVGGADAEANVASLEAAPGRGRRQLGPRGLDERAVGHPRVEDDPQLPILF